MKATGAAPMKTISTIFFLALIFFPVQSFAEGNPAANAEILLHAEKDALYAGLDLHLTPGWYTYWRMPGDSGLAPKFNWGKSQNIKDVEIFWPAPQRFTLFDLHSFGYQDHVLWPMKITPVMPGQEITLTMQVDLAVCKEICVPLKVEAARVIRPEAYNNPALAKALKNLPRLENDEARGIEGAVLGKDSIVVSAYAKNGFEKNIDLIVETPGFLLTAPPQILIDEKDKTRALLKIPAAPGADLSQKLFGASATILLIENGNAVEKKILF
jgi:suppressor for copper-sensitivity B